MESEITVECRQIDHTAIDVGGAPHVRVNVEFVLLRGSGSSEECLGFKSFDIPLSEVVINGA